MMDFRSDPRFKGITPFERRVWLSSPTMHGEELRYMTEAYETNWMSTIGSNIDAIEDMACKYTGAKKAIALSSGTAALHMAIKLAAQKLYGAQKAGSGMLAGRKVFCSDLTFSATVNPVAYEQGEAIFIDAEYDTWNMDPENLEHAFDLYPETRLVVAAHLYGTPGKIDELRRVCHIHDALLIEDAAESLGAVYKEEQTGILGDYGMISFNGNKIITGSSGGMLLVKEDSAEKQARKWCTQSREDAPWYQHEALGYNYRMSNVIAGVVRGQFGHIGEHIERKREIYLRYKEGLKDLPVSMNPFNGTCSTPNFWLSCMLIDCNAVCSVVRSDKETLYVHSPGKTCPDEILEALSSFNIEGRPIWKPMHMQPLYRSNIFISKSGSPCEKIDVGADLFSRGVCLPSDNKMTNQEQDIVIDIIHRCFK